MYRLRKTRRLTSAVIFLLVIPLALPIAPLAMAQSSKGILVGTVTDPTGAVISGASVKITNTATGVVRETVALEDGNFRLDAVDPGTYKVEVSASGFKTVDRDGVIVAAGQSSTEDFNLEVGATTEVVNVTGNAGVELQKQDGARTDALDSRQIVDLPVAGLNPANLVFTLPGITDPGPLSGGFVQGTEFSINGLRPRANNQLIDGTDNNDNSITGQFYQPVLRDGYSEVSVLGGDNSAEYGRAGGAVINVITKSGTNQFHGSAYDVINTSALSALSSGQKSNEGLTDVPVYIDNTFGFSIGGPVLKDKLFFFGTLQGDRIRSSAVTATGVVPTTAGFNLLRSLFPQGSSANLDQYLSIVGDLRGTTNTILVPLGGNRPDIPFGTATSSAAQPVNDWQWLTRIDWARKTNDLYAFRYLFDQQTFSNQFPTAFAGFDIDVPSRIQNFYFSNTHVFSPKLTNEFRFSYGRFRVNFGPANDEALVEPQFRFGGTTITSVGLDPTFPQGRIFNNFQYQDTVSYTVGTHTIRAGFDLLRQLAKQLVPFNDRGTLTFSAGGGFPAFGNFVDAFSGTQGTFAEIVFGSPVIYPDAFQQAYFVNDSWRVRPNFTLNLGLRYENYGTPFNVIPFPAFAGLDVPLETSIRQKRDNNNFAPRISFAYTPNFGKRFLGGGNTVIRGGYAISYDVFFNNILSNTAASSPNVLAASLFGATVGGRGFAGAGVGSLPVTASPDPLASITSIAPDLVNPMTHVWNFGIQHELPGNIIFDVAYVGSRGERLFINEQVNPGVDDVRLDPARGSVTIRTNGGDSIYHSLQTRLEHGFRNGLLARFAYTFSKAIDDVNSEVFVTTGGSSVGSDPFNRSVDRSVASFNVPHRAVWSFLYNIPGPRKGLMNQIAGEWTVSGIYSLQSGANETPFVGGIDLNGDLNAFNDRPAINNANAAPNSVAILASLLGVGSPTNYVDANGNPVNPADAFYIVDPAFRSNIAGRNLLRADWTNRFDLSLNKGFRIPREGQRFDVRFEFFNLFNHPNFTWDSTVSNGDVLNPFFNLVQLNDGGIAGPTGNSVGRYIRIQARYSF
jgi:hypothetical protein